MRFSTIRIAFLFAVFTCCTLAQGVIRPYPYLEGPEWQRAVEKGARSDTGTPGEKHWANRADYDIEATLDPSTAEVRGHVRMTYFNHSPDRLRTLMIHLRQNLHKEGVQRNVDVELTGGMLVENIKVNGEELRRTRRRITGTTLRLRLPTALSSGEQVTVEMDFSFRVPKAGRAPRMGHEDHHVYFLGYWYPQFAVYDDVRGWVADPYKGKGEFYMGYGNYKIAITAPHGWIVRSTGELQNPKKVLPQKIRSRLKKAASSKDVVNIVTKKEMGHPGKATLKSKSGELTWRFAAENVRDAAVSISDRYLWDATHATFKDLKGKKQTAMVHAVYEASARGWDKGAEYCRHTLEFMSNRTYPYPWPHMTACEGIVGGGMEFPMMTDVGTTGSSRGVQGTIAHETIHMWFPMICGSNEKNYSFMDEGLTTFFTSLVGADYFKRPDPTSGQVRGYARFARQGREVASMRHTDTFPPASRAYGFAAYQKPSAVMHQLKGMLGEEKFHEALSTYARNWAYDHPYPYDLFNTFSEVAGRDLSWYFRTWCFETFTLDMGVTVKATDEGKSNIAITAHGTAVGDIPVLVDLEGGGTKRFVVKAEEWLKNQGNKTVHIPMKGKRIQRVVLDPDQITLDVNSKNNTWTK